LEKLGQKAQFFVFWPNCYLVKVPTASKYIVSAIFAIGFLWSVQAVYSSYATFPTAVKVQLTGVDLAVEATDIEESPYKLDVAEDTRRKPVSLAYVQGTSEKDEPSIDVLGGNAAIKGSVYLSDSSPAEFAIVRLERHTSEGIGTLDVQTNSYGEYLVEDLLGGRYRVRSWIPNIATATESQVVFLDDKAKEPEGNVKTELEGENFTAELNFRLSKPDSDLALLELVDGGPIFVDSNGLVALSVTNKKVDHEGIIAISPIQGADVEIKVSQGLTAGSTKFRTNQSGTALLNLTCESIGSGTLNASVSFITTVSETDETGLTTLTPKLKKFKKSFATPDCIPVPVPEVVPEVIATPNVSAGGSNG